MRIDYFIGDFLQIYPWLGKNYGVEYKPGPRWRFGDIANRLRPIGYYTFFTASFFGDEIKLGLGRLLKDLKFYLPLYS